MRNPAAEMEGPAHRDLRNHGEEIRLLVASERCEGAVDLPGGSSLRIVESRRDKIDPNLAMPMLRGAYGEGADAAVSVSKTGPKKFAGPDLSCVMAELEHAGAIEVTRSESLREVGKRD